jgi:(p)ppGpp synthase/HD superfamily hydrolase
MNTKIIGFAIEAHQKVNHLYDGKPYSLHLSMVAIYAIKYIDLVPESQYDNMTNAAWLHDTIEDCRLTYNDVKEVAGLEVAEIVYALSNEKGRNRKERASSKYYEGIRNVPFARFVKLCDRLANVKYSKDTNSKMISVYRKEHENFIESLIPAGSDKRHYQPMIAELEQLLKIK